MLRIILMIIERSDLLKMYTNKFLIGVIIV